MILFNIGYENHNKNSLSVRLRQHGVRFLADVRAYPVSCREGMSTGELRHLCKTHGMSYRDFSGLGVPASLRRQIRASGNFDLLRDEYLKLLDHRKKGLGLLRDLIAANEGRVCLFCYEHSHARCHRSVLALRLKEMIPGLIITDL